MVEVAQALLAAQAADAIAGFIYRIHCRENPTGQAEAEYETEYETNPSFNAFVDGQHDIIRIFDLEFAPSEVSSKWMSKGTGITWRNLSQCQRLRRMRRR
jgi:hypothetical protein